MDSSSKDTPGGGELKAWRFAIGRAQIKEIKTDQRKNEIWRPGGDDWRNPSAFTEGEKKMGKKVHREYKHDGAGHARKHAAARIADSERGGDAYDHQTGPRQRDSIIQMGAKR